MKGPRILSFLVLLAVAAAASGCEMTAPSFGTRTDFVPPKDECWPAVERCHDSVPLCPALCR